MNNNNKSRRSFIKNASVGALSMAGLPLVSGCTGNSNFPWCSNPTFDGNHWWNQFNWRRVEQEVTAFNLPIEGDWPLQLAGTYMRNGANNKNGDSEHYFVGDGMVHGVTIEDGSALVYRNRWVNTTILGENIAGGMFPDQNQSNTNVIYHGGKILSLNEAGYPYQLDEELATIGTYRYDGKLKGPMTAHPKFDPVTGEMHFFGISPIFKPYLTYYVANAAGVITKAEPITLPGSSMMHDFQITRRHAIFMDLPIVFNLVKATCNQFPYDWKPSYGARFGIMPRDGGDSDIKWFEVETCFVFHTLNAYENPNNLSEIIVEATRTESIWETDTYDIDKEFFPYRWKFNLDTGVVTEDVIDDLTADFGKINPNVQGTPQRYSYFMTMEPAPVADAGSRFRGIRRYDYLANQMTEYIYPENLWPDEVSFVPNLQGTAEDDGWLVGYLYDSDLDSSYLVVLNAADIESGPIARIALPQRVPFGFHGTWVPA